MKRDLSQQEWVKDVCRQTTDVKLKIRKFEANLGPLRWKQAHFCRTPESHQMGRIAVVIYALDYVAFSGFQQCRIVMASTSNGAISAIY